MAKIILALKNGLILVSGFIKQNYLFILSLSLLLLNLWTSVDPEGRLTYLFSLALLLIMRLHVLAVLLRFSWGRSLWRRLLPKTLERRIIVLGGLRVLKSLFFVGLVLWSLNFADTPIGIKVLYRVLSLISVFVVEYYNVTECQVFNQIKSPVACAQQKYDRKIYNFRSYKNTKN